MDDAYNRLINNGEIELYTDGDGNIFYGCKHCGNRVDSIDDLNQLDENMYVCPKCYSALYPG